MNQNLPPATTPQPKSGTTAQYDAKTKGFMTMGIVAIALIGLIIPLFFMFYPEYERSQLLKTGDSAQAEIVSVRPTGSTFNDQPQVRILLRVTPEEGEPFESTATMIINPFYAPLFQPGKTVMVRYDAEDRSKITIEDTE